MPTQPKDRAIAKGGGEAVTWRGRLGERPLKESPGFQLVFLCHSEFGEHF